VAGPLEAPGEPDDPELPKVVAGKVRDLLGSTGATPVGTTEPPGADGLAALGPDQLLGILSHAPTEPADA
jgi:hypothetical protein